MRHYGLFITPVELAREMAFTRAGTSSKELQKAASLHGMESRLIRLDPSEFDRLSGPCIAYVPSDISGLAHNVVIYRVAGDQLWIADPGRGKYKITRAAFSKRYDGLLLILRPGATFRKGKLSDPYWVRFRAFVNNYRVKIMLSLGVGLVTSAVGFVLIYFSKYFVDSVLPTLQVDMVILFAAVYFLARLLNAAATAFNGIFTVALRNSVMKALSQQFIDQTLDLEKKHIDQRDAGDFLIQFHQIEMLTEGIAKYFANFVLVVLGILVKAGFLIWFYDPGLVSLILVILCLNAGVGFLFSNLTADIINRKMTVLSQTASTILDSVADVRLVRIYAARAWLERGYLTLLEEGLKLAKRFAAMEVYGRSLADLLSMVSEAAIFLICGMRIMDGSYTVGDFLVFFAFAQGLTTESRQFPELILAFQGQLRSFARIQAIVTMPRERVGGKVMPAGKQGSEKGLEIAFQNVSFAYTPGFPVLERVSFVIERNRTCAFVGESGSGKTTIMNLIMGFYQPDTGHILVDGQDLQGLDLTRYRQRISAIFQDTSLFHKSLHANVALGNDVVTEAKLRSLARVLGIDRFIEDMPAKYLQPLYPGSVSGGQTQQIGILRALCRPFDLLIMDEATSHLDARTEARIVQGIQTLKAQGRTMAVVAHRLSTVRSADKIIVMKQGRVAEMGKHEALIQSQGDYWALIQRQYEVNLAPPPSPA